MMQAPNDGAHTMVLDRFVPGEGIVSETIWEAGGAEPGGDVVTDFVHAIREGREPRTSLERALVVQKLTDAIYASSESGASVPV